jgi:hypothetical protein
MHQHRDWSFALTLLEPHGPRFSRGHSDVPRRGSLSRESLPRRLGPPLSLGPIVYAGGPTVNDYCEPLRCCLVPTRATLEFRNTIRQYATRWLLLSRLPTPRPEWNPQSPGRFSLGLATFPAQHRSGWPGRPLSPAASAPFSLTLPSARLRSASTRRRTCRGV